MMILIIIYLNYYYNLNKINKKDNYIIYFLKRLFLLYLLYTNTFNELIFNYYPLFLNDDDENFNNEEIIEEKENKIIDSFEMSVNNKIEDEEQNNLLEDFLIKDNINENISEIEETEELKNFINENEEIIDFIKPEEEIVDIIQPELLEEEISLDNIHFGSFIDSLNEIEDIKKKPLPKEVKKIKVGKNKKITIEMILN